MPTVDIICIASEDMKSVPPNLKRTMLGPDDLPRTRSLSLTANEETHFLFLERRCVDSELFQHLAAHYFGRTRPESGFLCPTNPASRA